MAARLILTNEDCYGYKYDDVHIVMQGTDGNLTASVTYNFMAPEAGDIVDAVLGVTNGADGTDPLNLELDVQINGTSCFTTKPKIDKTAGTGWKTTVASGTGITVGSLDTAKVAAARGDKITIVLTLVRTTPETESSDPAAIVTMRFSKGSTP